MRSARLIFGSTDQLCFVARHAQGIGQAFLAYPKKVLWVSVSIQVVSVIREAKTLQFFSRFFFPEDFSYIQGRPDFIKCRKTTLKIWLDGVAFQRLILLVMLC